MWLNKEEQWALTLSTFAGLSTTRGATFAVSQSGRGAREGRNARTWGLSTELLKNFTQSC